MQRLGVWSVFGACVAGCSHVDTPCGSEVELGEGVASHVGLAGGQVVTLAFAEGGALLERFSLADGLLTRLETLQIPGGVALAASGDVVVVEVDGARRILAVTDGFPLLYEEPGQDRTAVGGTVVFTGNRVLDTAASPIVPEPVGETPSGWTPILDGYRTVWPNTASPELATLPALDDVRELSLYQGVPQLGIDAEVVVRHAAFDGDRVWLNVATDGNGSRFLLEVDWATAEALRAVPIHTDAGHVVSAGDRLYLPRVDGALEVLDPESLASVAVHEVGPYSSDTVRADGAHVVWIEGDGGVLRATRAECL